MLGFLRKHQKYFFFVITVVVIISFSFFGTQDTLVGNSIHEQVAFTALDGTKVKRPELDSMAIFLGTDNDDKRLFGGAWGPNFLNDGVIKRDFLATGLAEILVTSYPEAIARDLQTRLDKEKRFTLYSHPQAKFISTESAWAYFLPNMKNYYDTLRSAQNPVSREAFAARVALFLNERRFPSPMLHQVLNYQQKQFSWVTPDPNLDHYDLSLFGYHTLDDWFGPRFMRLVSEFIINSSKLAEQKGYQVSKTEALADLQRNSEISYHQNIRSHHLGVANSNEYFNEQLRLLGIDQTRAVKIWQQVMLFRRLFQDVGNAALVDSLMPQKFYSYAKDTVRGDLFHLPSELHFADYRTLQKFELYLYTVAKRAKIEKMNDKELLAVPATFLSMDEIKKKYPEMIQKRYVLRIAETSKAALSSKVGLKEMWNWEVEEANWGRLKKEFPVLGVKQGNTREERFAALDSLDDRTRARVDAFARAAIVDAHPEWLAKALEGAEEKEMDVGIRSKGGASIVAGLDNREELMRLLDAAPLVGQSQALTPANKEADSKLTYFTGNHNNYYRIQVIERKPNEEILTFAEADKDGVLDQLLDKLLESHYQKMREASPAQFRKEDGSLKTLADVRDVVADSYFDKLVKAIQNDYVAASGDKSVEKMTGDRAASLRFYAYMRDYKTQLEEGTPEVQEQVIEEVLDKDQKAPRSLTNQWKLAKNTYHANRTTENESVDIAEMMSLPANAWTKIHAPVNGDIYFMQVKGKDSRNDIAAVFEKTNDMHRLLSYDAQRHLMHSVISILKAKNAISLDYLESSEEEMGPEETVN